jgi:hypothetical protein
VPRSCLDGYGIRIELVIRLATKAHELAQGESVDGVAAVPMSYTR